MNAGNYHTVTVATGAGINSPMPSEARMDRVDGKHSSKIVPAAIYYPTARFFAGIVSSVLNTKGNALFCQSDLPPDFNRQMPEVLMRS